LDLRQVGRLWGDHPGDNVGVRTGAAAGLRPRVARGAAGVEALRDLEARPGKLPRTPAAEGGGDTVFVFTLPKGRAVPTVADLAGLPLEVKAEDSWFLAPPSPLPGGGTQRWAISRNHPPRRGARLAA
jgi:hypothetical protein